jgi:hypothetical protein
MKGQEARKFRESNARPVKDITPASHFQNRTDRFSCFRTVGDRP